GSEGIVGQSRLIKLRQERIDLLVPVGRMTSVEKEVCAVGERDAGGGKGVSTHRNFSISALIDRFHKNRAAIGIRIETEHQRRFRVCRGAVAYRVPGVQIIITGVLANRVTAHQNELAVILKGGALPVTLDVVAGKSQVCGGRTVSQARLDLPITIAN